MRVGCNYYSEGLKSKKDFCLSEWIQARPSGNFFMLRYKEIIPPEYYEDEPEDEKLRIENDEQYASFGGIFRTYSE